MQSREISEDLDVKISLGRGFSGDLNKFSAALGFWAKDGVRKLLQAHETVGVLVKGQAKKRVPVATNRLKQGILTVTYSEGVDIVTEVGTNVKSKTGFPYPIVIEFGSKHIAAGRVKALGEDPNITDAQAITDWPAKLKRSAARQQMPFLRPAWAEVMPEALALINNAFIPPKQK